MCYVCEPVNTSESDKEYEYEHRVIEHIKADPFHFPPSSRLGPESPSSAPLLYYPNTRGARPCIYSLLRATGPAALIVFRRHFS
jgi:hypothetical protein